jgi:hypothetical protein
MLRDGMENRPRDQHHGVVQFGGVAKVLFKGITQHTTINTNTTAA